MSQALSPRFRFVAVTALLAVLLPGASTPSPARDLAPEGSSQAPGRSTVSGEKTESTDDAVDLHRVPVPSLSRESNHPFSVEVPASWGVRRDVPAPGVFLGPPGGDPNTYPEMLLIQESEVSLESPHAVLANLRSNAQESGWSLREAELTDFGGVQGLWIVREMPPAGLHGERVSFAVKLPLGDRSLNILATVPVDQSEALAPRIESMLRSVRPTGTVAASAPADGPEE